MVAVPEVRDSGSQAEPEGVMILMSLKDWIEDLKEEIVLMGKESMGVIREVARDDSKEQRENLFHCRCDVNGKICSVIMDNGSCANIASEMMVKALGLTMKDHPEPYKLQWLSESGELKEIQAKKIQAKGIPLRRGENQCPTRTTSSQIVQVL